MMNSQKTAFISFYLFDTSTFSSFSLSLFFVFSLDKHSSTSVKCTTYNCTSLYRTISKVHNNIKSNNHCNPPMLIQLRAGGYSYRYANPLAATRQAANPAPTAAIAPILSHWSIAATGGRARKKDLKKWIEA